MSSISIKHNVASPAPVNVAKREPSMHREKNPGNKTETDARPTTRSQKGNDASVKETIKKDSHRAPLVLFLSRCFALAGDFSCILPQGQGVRSTGGSPARVFFACLLRNGPNAACFTFGGCETVMVAPLFEGRAPCLFFLHLPFFSSFLFIVVLNWRWRIENAVGVYSTEHYSTLVQVSSIESPACVHASAEQQGARGGTRQSQTGVYHAFIDQ